MDTFLLYTERLLVPDQRSSRARPAASRLKARNVRLKHRQEWSRISRRWSMYILRDLVLA